MEYSVVILGLILIIGLVIGSFLNVVILRAISGESIVFPASKCPKCNTPLKWYHNIPVLSYIFLRGKCAFCKCHISIQYPIVELLTGIIFVLLFLKTCTSFFTTFGLDDYFEVSVEQWITYGFLLISVFFMLAMAGTDIIEKQIINYHYLPPIIISSIYGISYSFIQQSLTPALFAIGAAIIGFILMELLSFVGVLLVKSRAFGDGDSYILAGIAATVGCVMSTSYIPYSFVDLLKEICYIVIASVIIQVIATLPIFIKKLVVNKNWTTIIALSAFTLYAIGYFYAQHTGLFSNDLESIICAIVLLALAIFACIELLYGLRKNKAVDGLYLPFGPALIVSGILAIFLL